MDLAYTSKSIRSGLQAPQITRNAAQPSTFIRASVDSTFQHDFSRIPVHGNRRERHTPVTQGVLQRQVDDTKAAPVTTYQSTPPPVGSLNPAEVKHLISSTVAQRLLVDSASGYKEYSFMWWWSRGDYGAALNVLDEECKRAGAPVAKFISGIFEPTAQDVERAATGFDPVTKKPLGIADRVKAGASAIADILLSALDVELKAGAVIVKVIDKKGAIEKLGEAILEQTFKETVGRPMGPTIDKDAAGDRRALPDKTYHASPVPIRGLPFRH